VPVLGQRSRQHGPDLSRAAGQDDLHGQQAIRYEAIATAGEPSGGRDCAPPCFSRA
jgi:hypothetical protein